MLSASPTAKYSDKREYNCIIVGAGGIGSAAAYHLAKDGGDVLLLEQFEIGHVRGSSHGGSRIIRYTHDTTTYAKQMPQTFELWRQLAQESGEPILQMTGGLYMGLPDAPFIAGAQTALAELGFPFEIFDADTLPSHYPQFRLPPGWIAISQEHTGMLAATRCVQTLARQAVRHGATLQENTRVIDIRPQPDADGAAVTVQGPSGEATYWGRQVIVCAGPWAPRFLTQLLDQPAPPLRVTHQQVVYYAVDDTPDGVAAYAPGRFPVFLCAADDFIYGLPVWERPGAIKVALEQETLTVDPEQGERPVNAAMLETLNRAVAHYLPQVKPQPFHVETCLYTETPSRDFIIDRHPAHPQVLIAAGFSGRGFKHAIAVGRLLADLVACAPGEYKSEFWLENYRLQASKLTG